MEWRAYDIVADRPAAHAILRDLLRLGPTPFTIHPGDWDWWTFHADPREQARQLISEHAIALVGGNDNVVSAFGAAADACLELGFGHFGAEQWSLTEVSDRDHNRIRACERDGFAPRDQPADPVFMRPTTGGVPGAMLPDGFSIRPVGGEPEHAARAAAARRAFASTMNPDMHAARYLRFMRSPAYVADHDLVAVAPDGRIAAFTVIWPDAETSLAQFEPVGTDPDFQRIGLARALIAHALERLHASGIERARVMTNGTNAAAIACYESCGFTRVDALRAWRAPT